ncbi:MAG: hypothetical protein QG658_417, partial [Patescibacteria group bacterium]|nr:hypothetical protein [Patescibacteria group bacterium]
SFGSLRADKGHAFTVDSEVGYDVYGYSVNNGHIVRSAVYNYVGGTVGDGATIDVDWIFRKKPTVNLSVTCPTISGSISGGGAANIELYARVAGEDLVDGTGQRIEQGKTFNFTVPEKYKDGVARTVQIRLIVDGTDIGVGTNGTGTLVCTRNAACISNNLATIFKDGRSTMNTGDSEGNIKIGMQNTGQAIWATYPSGTYRLGLTTESQEFWDINPALVPGKIYPAPAAAGTVDSLEFSPAVTLKKQPTDGTTPLVFIMEFVPSDGSASIPFGGTCGTSIRVLSAYGPWLRTQNGNVSAMGIIQGQGVVTADGGSLGGRRSAGVASGANKDDLNYEVTYLAMSQNQNSIGTVGAAIGSGPFCSTNAYLLARDDASGVSDNTASCKFNTYAFRLRDSLADALKKSGSTELIYREASTAYDDATCNPAVGPTGSGTGRFAKGANSYNGNNNIPGLNGACPTITELSVQRDLWYTLGSTIGSATPALQNLTVQSRSTIIVPGDLYLNANIRNAAAPAASFNVNDLNGLNALPNLGIIVKGNIIIDRDVTQIDASLYATGEIRTCDLYDPDKTDPDSSETTTGFKPEQNAGNKKNDTAFECADRLVIRGLAAAKSGFKFGRNFVDFAAIASPSRVGRGQFTPDFDYGTDRSLYYGKPAEDVLFNGLILLAPPPGFEYLASPDFTSARYVSDNAQPRF